MTPPPQRDSDPANSAGNWERPRYTSMLLKTALSAVVLHGVFTVGIPALILRHTGAISLLAVDVGRFRWLGAPPGAFGVYLYLWSVVRLLRKRTLAVPCKAPSVLMTDGRYAHARPRVRRDSRSGRSG